METYLIAGLGNPGDEYKNTRHNVGFLCIDYIAEQFNAGGLNNEKKFNADIANILHNGYKVLLTKPQTFMNNSGESIQKISEYYQVPPKNIFIIHDDLDIAINEYKIQLTKGPRQHNGIISIENHLNTNEFNKIRVGIENRGELRNKISGKDYVLSNFTHQEKETLSEDIFPAINSDLRSRIK
jgi:PTH1 family peptidyl-tRNA hydrolase